MSGPVYNLPREAYDAIERPSFSRLKHFSRSPAHYRAALTGHRDSDAMRFGRVLHLAVLEPDLLPSQVAVWSGGRRAGKEWDAFKSHHAAREILTEAEFDDVQGAALSVLARREFGPYLTGPSEVSIKWECEGILLKSRLDKVSRATGRCWT